MNRRSLIQTACFAIIVLGTGSYIYSRFAPAGSIETGILKETALSVPLVLGLGLLSLLNLHYFSSRLKPQSPGLPQTVYWLFSLACSLVAFLSLSQNWLITPMRVLSFFLVTLILSLLLNAGTYLHFRKSRAEEKFR